jgi:hypothetical protein
MKIELAKSHLKGQVPAQEFLILMNKITKMTIIQNNIRNSCFNYKYSSLSNFSSFSIK